MDYCTGDCNYINVIIRKISNVILKIFAVYSNYLRDKSVTVKQSHKYVQELKVRFASVKHNVIYFRNKSINWLLLLLIHQTSKNLITGRSLTGCLLKLLRWFVIVFKSEEDLTRQHKLDKRIDTVRNNSKSFRFNPWSIT